MPLIVTPGQLNRRAELYHQLGSMIGAGVPLIKALEMVSVRPAVVGSRQIFLKLVQNLQSGKTFAQSMTAAQGWMPEFDIALLSVGEQSGRLDTTFKLLSLYYAFRAKIISDTISGLLITIATLHVFLLVFPLGFLITFVQGIMANNYSECTPFILEKIMAYGSLYGVVFLLVYACQGKHGNSWRSIIEAVTRAVPILGTAQKYLVLSRLTAALEALNSAGVSIVSGWQIAAKASGSPHLARNVAGWDMEFANGATSAELVNKTDYFPVLFANLYDTGEQSGKLEETLKRLHEYYQEEGFRSLRLFTKILNGLLYAAMALTVAFYVINFYTGYFKAGFELSQ